VVNLAGWRGFAIRAFTTFIQVNGFLHRWRGFAIRAFSILRKENNLLQQVPGKK
jgi:hypothetical protein